MIFSKRWTKLLCYAGLSLLIVLCEVACATDDPAAICSAVLMVRPVHFGYNAQTAATNRFQHTKTALSTKVAQEMALAEFDQYVTKLRDRGVSVVVVEDTANPKTPDSIFPNNWLSVHPNGQMVTYPLLAENRRLERRNDIAARVRRTYRVTDHLDISAAEANGKFLEGTGSIVFDHANKLAYACLSPRTDETLFRDLCQHLKYKPIVFHATDAEGVPIYHTNVMMSIGRQQAVICSDVIRDSTERRQVLASLEGSGHKIVSISENQMNHFCGNVYELSNPEQQAFWVMSDQAYAAFTPKQKAALEYDQAILHTPLNTIEALGGGGARCMVAGVHAKRL